MFSGSIVAIVTPMTSSGELDYPALEQLVNWHIECGTDGIVVMGTTGESGTVESSEYNKAIETVVQAVDKASENKAERVIKVIAGTGAMSTTKTIQLTAQAKEQGVDGALVVTPYYCRPSQEGMYQHYKALIDAVDLPIILYNVPGRTACDLLPETVARLAVFDNIVAIKEATGDVSRVAELIRLCETPITLLSGDDATALEFIRDGGHGVISVTANVTPELMSAMCHAALNEQWDKAQEFDKAMAALNHDLFIEANPVPVKWALYRMNIIDSGIRLPLTQLSQRHHNLIEKALEKAHVKLS